MPGDQIDGSDIKILAVTPYGFWATYQLSAPATGFRPDLIIDGQPVPYPAANMGSYSRVAGPAGLWVGPIYYTGLEPNTAHTLAFEQPGGGQTGTLPFITREAPPAPGTAWSLSQAMEDAMDPNGAWASLVRAEPSTGWNPAALQGSYRAYPKAMLAAVTGDSQDIADAVAILQFAEGPRSDTEGTSGSQHRWEGAYLAWAASLLYHMGAISESRFNSAADLLLDDLQAVSGWTGGTDDSDKQLSNTRIGLIGGSMYTLMAAGARRDAFQAIYQEYERLWYGVQLPRLRINGRFGNAGGWPNDGSGYGTASLGYIIEVLWWMANDRPQELADYVPWFENAACMQAHMEVPGRSVRFSWGDLVGSEIDQGGTHIAAQSDTRHFLGWAIREYGGDAAIADHLERITGVDYNALCALPVVAGPGLMPTTYINYAGDSAAVFSRTDWTDTARALMFKINHSGVHHNHADRLDLSFWNSGWVVQETPHYGFNQDGTRHNTPVGQPTGQGDSDHNVNLTAFEVDDWGLDMTAEAINVWSVPVTRRVQWNKLIDFITVTDTGVTDAYWNGPGTVATVAPGLYTIQ